MNTAAPDYERPVAVADGIFWVGFHDRESGLHCNPYLVTDGDEAVLIDGGSRPDFAAVMMKIMQTGVNPKRIRALIYDHFDPDLCGSIPNLEDIIGRDDLVIISDKANHMFLRHYQVGSRLAGFEELGHVFRFASGRELRLINTPYAHAAGSSLTFDPATGTLFSGDLFGSLGRDWELVLRLSDDCATCAHVNCPHGRSICPVPDLVDFHRLVMPSTAALRYALAQVMALPVAAIAPQHGSIIRGRRDILTVIDALLAAERVGIDRLPAADLTAQRTAFAQQLPE